MRIYLFIFSVIFTNSCTIEQEKRFKDALDFSGKNASQLEQVIDYYKINRDSSSLIAAYFLINNMLQHESKSGCELFIPAFDSAYSKYNGKKRFSTKETFDNKVDSIIKFNPDFRAKVFFNQDIVTVRSNFLIENIDLSLEARNRIKKFWNYNDEMFLNYVLPHKCANEPLELGLRRMFYKEFNWVFDSLKSGQKFSDVVADLFNSMELMHWRNKVPGIPPAQMHKVRFGDCEDMAVYAVNILRALGIPSTIDKITQYGDQNNGHSWVVVFTPTDTIYRNAESDKNVYPDMQVSSIPKIFRSSYQYQDIPTILGSNWIDVTNEYRSTVNGNVHSKERVSKEKVAVAVFDGIKSWVPVEFCSSKKGKSYTFLNLGKDIIYLPIALIDEQYVPIDYPFYFDVNDLQITLKPDNIVSNAILERKFPPYFIRNNREKIKRIHDLNGTKILLSNESEFINPEEDSIVALNSTQEQNKLVNKTYQYLKIACKADDISRSFAEFRVYLQGDSLFNPKAYIRKPVILNHKWNFTWMGEKLVDQNPLTYLGGKNLTITYNFQEPVLIEKIVYQARNDDNHIRIGDQYELFYWDNKWQSLGNKVAEDTMLAYTNIPANALYWLKNHSRGKEEQVFLLSNTGQQIWPSLQYHQ